MIWFIQLFLGLPLFLQVLNVFCGSGADLRHFRGSVIFLVVCLKLPPQRKINNRCFHFLDRCRHCCEVQYCSQSCRDRAWSQYHNIECSLRPLLKMVGIMSFIMQQQRCLIRHFGNEQKSGGSLISQSLAGLLLGTMWLLIFCFVLSNYPTSDEIEISLFF